MQNFLVDIEEVGLQFNRQSTRRQNGLYVTDFSAAEWCQQQVAFSLSARIPKACLHNHWGTNKYTSSKVNVID